jgi:hypothetical protein
LTEEQTRHIEALLAARVPQPTIARAFACLVRTVQRAAALARAARRPVTLAELLVELDRDPVAELAQPSRVPRSRGRPRADAEPSWRASVRALEALAPDRWTLRGPDRNP